MTHKLRKLSRPSSATVAMLLLMAGTLGACGGGGDDGKQPSQPVTATVPPNTPQVTPTEPPEPPPPPPTLAPACTDCGATDANSYAGNGVGVWQAINATSESHDVPLNIAGLDGQEVTLVLTNTTGIPKIMPTIALTTPQAPTVAASMLQWDHGATSVKQQIADFNREGWVALAGKRGDTPSYSIRNRRTLAAVNDTRNWYNEVDNTTRSARLVRQGTTSDGTTVNFWLEESESAPDRVSPAILDSLFGSFTPAGRIYDMLKSIGGPVWGPHAYPDLIPATGQPIDIVILNFDRNGEPLGLLGYFHARNAFARDATTNPHSNESVSLYLDAETLYLGGPVAFREMHITMAHEAMHMQNFYRRGVLRGPKHVFDRWLEEASAMMMEDFASHTVDPAHHSIRDIQFPGYVAENMYNCNLTGSTTSTSVCDTYAVGGSFGGFLNRQLGLDFYRNLLNNFSSTSSVMVLESAIRSTAPSSGIGDQLRKFAATSGALMRSPSPAGFGFPARVDGGFTLPAIDPQAYLPLRTLAQSVPLLLAPYGSLPISRGAVRGAFSETVTIPPGTTLSVVVQ
ncbi:MULTISPECIES: hemagglutinin [unclassified Cupriavidus]|uniref:M30 family zinc metallopeptidase n=1 Tax=unclassified Cupriavidus TaxID=2640874 RepID=UPI001C007AD3|nr:MULTISPECIES: hemagglutinin [unclassified Cupriavidus]MCA3191609.1 hemagglutinin [Cupriavidus sp.]MCA3199796.1 hemagglutinin [Cupriavidus sp.]MCA3201630.1 hemagglutinin [Cupriavidus sp.]MCA3205639.1 hemagglutinin [Cupriavidus sp.]QWE93365.1 hemagglutinin [Cupriavidus sp. EM10]